MQAGAINAYITSPLGVIIFVIALWCAVCFFISFLTGWFALSRRFRKQSEPYGDVRSAGPFLYTVYMRFWSHYSSVIRLVAAEDALYASVLPPFRIGHPPLRIPWDEIQFSRTKYLWLNLIQLTLGNEEKIPMRISLRMARNLGVLDRFPV
ncbi:MAG: hypothetical protein ABSD70_06090 [Terracidiphilus sp.]|jgi:hypothetical protein